jgi:hypothetical protein
MGPKRTHAMQDLWWHLQNVDSFVVYVSLAFAVIICLFFREIVGSPTLGWISIPVLAFGGILAPTLLAQNMLTLSYDRTVNAVMSTALGTLGGLIMLLLVNWLWAIFIEFRVNRTRLAVIPTRPRRIR